MKPEKALELVTSYATLTRAIKAFKPAIGAHLDKCDVKHIGDWYANPEPADYETHGYDVPVMITQSGEWLEIGEKQRLECEHCYAAHLVVQERKAMRKKLVNVKRSMSLLTK